MGCDGQTTNVVGREVPNDAKDFFYATLIPPTVKDGADKLNGHWNCQFGGQRLANHAQQRLELSIGAPANVSRVQGKFGSSPLPFTSATADDKGTPPFLPYLFLFLLAYHML
jgi:hypothetical protein